MIGPATAVPKSTQTRNEPNRPSVSPNSAASRSPPPDAVRNAIPAAKAATKPLPPTAVDAPYASSASATTARCSEIAVVQPRRLARASSQPPRPPTSDGARHGETDPGDGFDRPIVAAEVLGRHGHGEEEGEEGRGDPVVQAALDVENAANARRDRGVGQERQAEGRIGRGQDDADHGRHGPALGGEQQHRQDGPERDRQGKAQHQQARPGRPGILLGVPDAHGGRVGEQQDCERELKQQSAGLCLEGE